MKKNILCFGDSNTWGYSPDGVTRYSSSVRWPFVMQSKLDADFKVIEEGHCGRTTIYDDPEVPDRNGIKSFPKILEANAPLDLVIIMLGTNDLKNCYSASAVDIAKSIEKLTHVVSKHNSLQNHMPEILVIAPPPLVDADKSQFKPTYTNGIKESLKMGNTITEYFKDTNINTFDAGHYIKSSIRDVIHLEPSEHIKLGELIAKKVTLIFA